MRDRRMRNTSRCGYQWTDRKKAVLKLNGGNLLIEWKDGIVYQEGPAEFVFDGELPD